MAPEYSAWQAMPHLNEIGCIGSDSSYLLSSWRSVLLIRQYRHKLTIISDIPFKINNLLCEKTMKSIDQ